MEHNGIFSNANLHEQPTHMESELPDSRKRSLETPAEEAGCTKRTNTGGKRDMSHPIDTLSTRRLRPAHHTVCIVRILFVDTWETIFNSLIGHRPR